METVSVFFFRVDKHSTHPGSQSSLSRASTDTTRNPQDTTRQPSEDVPRPSLETTRSSAETLRRPSLDMLRLNQGVPKPFQEISHPQEIPPEDPPARTPVTPLFDSQFGSVRSILRDPKTPGTGQSVRFFSRDAYKVISPDQSMDVEHQPVQQQLQSDQGSFLDLLNRAVPESTSTPGSMPRSAHTKSRPSVTEVFSPLRDDGNLSSPPSDVSKSNGSLSLTTIPPPDFSNLFDVSQQFDMPSGPPGLGFDVPLLDTTAALNSMQSEDGLGNGHRKTMTSTPYKVKPKGKGKENLPMPVDETIFHAHEKSPRLPQALHDRSQSFSFGQTVFYSMANSTSTKGSPESSSICLPPGDLKPAISNLDIGSRATSPVFSKNRSRSHSDTVFQSMMRSSPKPPEADIDDASSSDLVVFTGSAPEPDPFSAGAATYYTPQTMIPVTPPQGAPKQHMRKTSKEESIIFSLQTQLTLQTELCSQYEADLRARDELVEILGKKLSDVEKEDGKRKGVLRAWKKKVTELEKTCRYLEEEVDSSRQESMERSVMDEASGEALRMLHRQIASLERERGEWNRKEVVFREEVETLEGLVKERSEDVMNLKEMLWNRDESERELKEGIREAKEQMEQMGNVSVVIDEDDLKKLVVDRQQKSDEEKERHRVAEDEWEEEKAELVAQLDDMKTGKEATEVQLATIRQQLHTRDEEYMVLKAELEAQWEHTEKATEKIQALEGEKSELEAERDALRHDVEELEERMANFEVEWTDTENKRVELEAEVQELWTAKEALEKEREQVGVENCVS